MKASKQSVKKLVVLGMDSGAPHKASRAKVQRRTDSLNYDPEVEAEELRMRPRDVVNAIKPDYRESGMIRRRARG